MSSCADDIIHSSHCSIIWRHCSISSGISGSCTDEIKFRDWIEQKKYCAHLLDMRTTRTCLLSVQ